MAADGRPFVGFLYAGLMIDADGAPRVIEYNVRFGDPETQPILLRLQSDLLELIEAALRGELDQTQAQWDPRACVGVVMAAEHYPASPAAGDAIDGLDETLPDDCRVFHAGTRIDGDRVVTSGGRVLTVCGLGESVALAQQRAYAAMEKISWRGEFHRSDIGWRAIKRESG
jgi:phosphoribosylamine--glycine ligase